MSKEKENANLEVPEKIFYFSTVKIQNIVPKSVGTINIDLASYFLPWINFCYYMLLVPFKIEHNGSMYYLRTNTFQKILCRILHPMICINSYFEFHEKFVDKIRLNPEIFIRALERFNTILFCFLFFYTVWFKKGSVLGICNISRSQVIFKKVNRNVTLYCLIVLSYSLISYVTLVFDLENSTWRKGYQKLIEKFRFEYYVTRRLRLATQTDDDIQIEQLTIALSTLAIFLKLVKWILMDFIISLTVLIGFVSYKLSKQFKDTLMESSQLEEKRIFQQYSEMVSSFNKLNELIGPILAVVFLFIITYCAVNTMDLLDSDDWSLPVFMTTYILFLFLPMVFSAEAHHQASYFKTWLLSCNRNGGSLTNLFGYLLEVEQCNLAIKGGRCFTITYSFLGTASSVVLTYAIIMIQFGGGKQLASNVTSQS